MHKGYDVLIQLDQFESIKNMLLSNQVVFTAKVNKNFNSVAIQFIGGYMGR